MATKSPATRRAFANEWDEIDYLYHKLLYWLYDRRQPGRAGRFADRLDQLLRKAPGASESIRGAECASLIDEAWGDLAGAIKWREKEVRRIRRLLDISRGQPGEAWIRGHYDWGDLSDRLDLLAILYHDRGDLDRAIRTLEESKQLCRQHRIAFDGQDLLDDYREEKRANFGRIIRREPQNRSAV
jgi:hypothetical protein